MSTYKENKADNRVRTKKKAIIFKQNISLKQKKSSIVLTRSGGCTRSEKIWRSNIPSGYPDQGFPYFTNNHSSNFWHKVPIRDQ